MKPTSLTFRTNLSFLYDIKIDGAVQFIVPKYRSYRERDTKTLRFFLSIILYLTNCVREVPLEGALLYIDVSLHLVSGQYKSRISMVNELWGLSNIDAFHMNWRQWLS